MFLVAGFLYAEIVTVNNAASSTAMYTNLQTAIDSAEVGDTIMVSASTVSYGDILIDKQVVLIGSGFQVGDRTIIQKFNFDNTDGNANGSVIKGFYVSSNYIDLSDQYQVVQNLLIERCYFTHHVYLYGSNIIIASSVFLNSLEIRGSNTSILNSILKNLNHSNSASNRVQNCLFIGVSQTWGFKNISALTMQNSILYNSNCNVSTITFQNCLTTGGNTIPDMPANENNQTIILGVDSLFVDAPNLSSFQFTADYHLDEASPAKEAGIGGVDLGIYGGDLPFSDNMAPAIPKIIYLNSDNSIVPKDGVLKVNVKAISVK